MTKLINSFFVGITKNTIFLAFSSLFADIATEMLYPILPIFLTQVLHANGSIVGLIEGLAQAVQNIVQGFSGWLADKLRNRKLIALIGYFLAAIAKPIMGMSTIWQEVFAGRFLDRFGTGIRSAPRDALIAASVTQEHKGKAFGLEGIGDNLGAFLGPIFTLLLLSLMHIDLRHIFYLAIIPGLLAFTMIFLVKEKQVAVQAKYKLDSNFKSFSKKYWKYLFVIGLFSLGNSSNAFLILQTKNSGISLEMTILIYAGFNLVAALVSYPAGFFSDLLERKIILFIAFIIFFITYVGFALTKNIFIISILFILYGCYQGIFRSVGKALAIDLVPERLHASGIGYYSATIGLLQLIASIVAGLLWDHVSHEAVFIYGSVFSAIGTIALLLLVPGKNIAKEKNH